ncbi:MAG: hypothetical protein JWN46_3870 [Acidimicrobiales bacterium]|nr:hypothetical protein [Acidimicrobiales bacterium]
MNIVPRRALAGLALTAAISAVGIAAVSSQASASGCNPNYQCCPPPPHPQFPVVPPVKF